MAMDDSVKPPVMLMLLHAAAITRQNIISGNLLHDAHGIRDGGQVHLSQH